jgi:hypothetical protein
MQRHSLDRSLTVGAKTLEIAEPLLSRWLKSHFMLEQLTGASTIEHLVMEYSQRSENGSGSGSCAAKSVKYLYAVGKMFGLRTLDQDVTTLTELLITTAENQARVSYHRIKGYP